MIKLNQNTPTAGDCTAGYAVSLDKPYTVREFVDEILDNAREWGHIGIYSEEQAWFEKGDPYIEYRHGVLTAPFSDEILEKTIIKATASGGWSLMDYSLTL